MRYRFYTTDVFTDRVFGGNPLVVFPDAGGLATETMQRIAGEFGVSETVFVFPPEQAGHTRRLRIFTPGTELPFAGHPTIGTAYVLARTGHIALRGDATRVIFEEGVGPVPVSILWKQGTVAGARMTAPQLPILGPAPPPLSAIAHVLSLDPHDLRADDYRPEAVSCGVPFLFVPLRGRDALRRARIDPARWDHVMRSWWAPSIYALCFLPDGAEASLSARMFAPGLGVVEDPATGAAVSALAGYLAPRDRSGDGKLQWRIEQGVDMGRPSRLDLEAERSADALVEVRVGGAAVMVSSGEMEVPG
ncbi:MAG TPA: PhzF family phenazine biosynthesis protein [Candidatus Polarisedimenticolaceae bacterium]